MTLQHGEFRDLATPLGESPAFMDVLDRVSRLARLEAVRIPVTIKMRLGWDDRSLNAPDIARRAEAAGIRLVTVHGRTRCQFFKGTADWSKVRIVQAPVDAASLREGCPYGPAARKSNASALQVENSDLPCGDCAVCGPQLLQYQFGSGAVPQQSIHQRLVPSGGVDRRLKHCCAGCWNHYGLYLTQIGRANAVQVLLRQARR